MKSLRLLVIIALLAVLLTYVGTIVVLADTPGTLTKDFGKVNGYDDNGGIAWTIDVTATIHTEPNGDWILSNVYRVNWLITLTYLNSSDYDGSSFGIRVYNPVNPFYNSITYITTNEATVNEQFSGTLSMLLTPDNVGNYSFASAFSLQVYYHGNLLTSGSWTQDMQNNNPPVYINVESNQQSPLTTPKAPEFPTLAALVIGLVVVSIITVTAITRSSVFRRREV